MLASGLYVLFPQARKMAPSSFHANYYELLFLFSFHAKGSRTVGWWRCHGEYFKRASFQPHIFSLSLSLSPAIYLISLLKERERMCVRTPERLEHTHTHKQELKMLPGNVCTNERRGKIVSESVRRCHATHKHTQSDARLLISQKSVSRFYI